MSLQQPSNMGGGMVPINNLFAFSKCCSFLANIAGPKHPSPLVAYRNQLRELSRRPGPHKHKQNYQRRDNDTRTGRKRRFSIPSWTYRPLPGAAFVDVVNVIYLTRTSFSGAPPCDRK